MAWLVWLGRSGLVRWAAENVADAAAADDLAAGRFTNDHSDFRAESDPSATFEAAVALAYAAVPPGSVDVASLHHAPPPQNKVVLDADRDRHGVGRQGGTRRRQANAAAAWLVFFAPRSP